jgi:hypothetical protein
MLMGCLVALLGCGNSGSTVTGKVTFPDGSPLSKGAVMYLGPTGTFQGSLSADGSYMLENVVAGQYKVVIMGAQDGGDSSADMQYDAQGNYINAAPAPRTSLISERFTDPDKSGISITVPGDYNIQVEKAG